MKHIAFIILLASSLVIAQVKTVTPTTVVPTPQQAAEIKLEISEFNAAMKDVKLAQYAAVGQRSAAMAKIAEVKAALKLDDTWEYDQPSNSFIKKPQPVQAPNQRHTVERP